MTDHTITVSCDGPSPEQTDAIPGDQVTFTNTTGADKTITLSGNGGFNPSPGGSFNLANNDSETKIVGSKKGEIDFSYPDCGDELGTRSGRIVVN
jgi:plastocyanin